ncbi:hypothetical protein MASR2M17_24530 [Aminivibrio sp.]
MQTVLKWGKEEITLTIPDKNVLAVLEPTGGTPLPDLGGAVAELLKNPTAGPSLEELVTKLAPRSVAIIVNDMTRSTPSAEMLPPVLEELGRFGVPDEAVAIVIATGTHRPMTDEETAATVGKAVFDRYRVENHDCDSPTSSASGPFPRGTVSA